MFKYVWKFYWQKKLGFYIWWANRIHSFISQNHLNGCVVWSNPPYSGRNCSENPCQVCAVPHPLVYRFSHVECLLQMVGAKVRLIHVKNHVKTIPILVLPSHSLSSSFPTTTSVLPNRARTLCPLLKCEWTGEILLHAWWSLDQVGRSWSSTGHDVKKPTWNHFYSTSDSSKKDQAMWIHPYNHHIQSWHIERIVNKKSACHFIAA